MFCTVPGAFIRRNTKHVFNSLPKGKILNWFKFKAFAENKMNLNEKLNFDFRKENIVGKGENAGYQHFLLFPQCFQKPSSLKVETVWQKVKPHLSSANAFNLEE